MTYVTEQTSAELRAHMAKITKMPGWHEPLADRLWCEVQTLEAENARLREALDLALCRLGKHEPGDSRAVSDEFVAMAAIMVGAGSPQCFEVIKTALAAEKATLIP